MTAVDDLGGSTSAKAHNWGTESELHGLVLEVRKEQATSFDGKELKTFQDGSPVFQWVFIVQVADPTESDDGTRAIYAKGGKFDIGEGAGESMLNAISGAYRTAKISEMEGAVLHLTNSGMSKPKVRGHQASRLFEAAVEAVA